MIFSLSVKAADCLFVTFLRKPDCLEKKLTPENLNVFRGLNGGRDKDRTCDPYDVNVVLSR